MKVTVIHAKESDISNHFKTYLYPIMICLCAMLVSALLLLCLRWIWHQPLKSNEITMKFPFFSGKKYSLYLSCEETCGAFKLLHTVCHLLDGMDYHQLQHMMSGRRHGIFNLPSNFLPYDL